MPRAWSLLALVVLVLGCRTDYGAAIETKCDASLRLRIQELARTDPDSLLDVLGQATGPVDEARHRRLESAGAQLRQVTGDAFMVRVAVKRVGEVAALDFVKSLALSQVREPLGP